jgi:hypothetical protein
LAICMKNPIRLMAKSKWGIASHLRAHKMHAER